MTVAGGGTAANIDFLITETLDPPVGNPPVAHDDPNYTMAEDGVLSVDAAGGVLTNDTDADGNTLLAVGRSEHVCVDLEGRVARIPQAVMNRLLQVGRLP